MKELTNQISDQDLHIEELQAKMREKDELIQRSQQNIEALKLDLKKQKDKTAKMDDENFKSKMAQLEQLE